MFLSLASRPVWTLGDLWKKAPPACLTCSRGLLLASIINNAIAAHYLVEWIMVQEGGFHAGLAAADSL